MTRIEDMSETERQSWVTLIVDVAVFFIFIKGMTTAGSIDTLSAPALSSFILGLIITTVILHIIIQSIFAARKRSEDDDLKDERDVRIERKGASYGFYVVAILLNILIGHIVIQNGIDALPNVTDRYEGFFDYTNTSHLVFALTFAAFLGDIVKNTVMILAYRGE